MASYSIAPGFFGAKACGSLSHMSNRIEQENRGGLKHIPEKKIGVCDLTEFKVVRRKIL